jgi:microcystin-dependent protein
VLAVGEAMSFYSAGQPNTTMNPSMLAPTGGSLPHNNMQPFLVLNFCIAMQGVFPPRG